ETDPRFMYGLLIRAGASWRVNPVTWRSIFTHGSQYEPSGIAEGADGGQCCLPGQYPRQDAWQLGAEKSVKAGFFGYETQHGWQPGHRCRTQYDYGQRCWHDHLTYHQQPHVSSACFVDDNANRKEQR